MPPGSTPSASNEGDIIEKAAHLADKHGKNAAAMARNSRKFCDTRHEQQFWDGVVKLLEQSPDARSDS